MTKRNSNKQTVHTIRDLATTELAATTGGGASLVGIDFGLLDSTNPLKAIPKSLQTDDVNADNESA